MMEYMKLFLTFPQDTQLLTDQERGNLIIQLILHHRDGKEPVFIGNERFLWAMFDAQMTRDEQTYERAAQAHRIAGANGGRPRKPNGSSENQKNQMVFEKTKKTNLVQDKDKDKDKDKDDDDDKDNDKDKDRVVVQCASAHTTTTTTHRMTRPSLDEVRTYCRQQRYTFSPEAFFNYYESNGWKVGRNPMRNWHSACGSWQSKQGMRTAVGKKVNAQMYEQRTDDITDAFAQFTPEEIEEMMRDEC